MVDIVIVNWNGGGHLRKCIDSLLLPENLPYIKKIFIIDNNSSDKSIEKLPHDSFIEMIKNDQNLGFAKACNQGFRLCNAPYTLLLNPDAQLFSSTIKDCIACLANKEEVDILGVALLNDDGKVTLSCSRFPTPLHFFYDAIGLSKMVPKIFTPALLMTDWDHTNSRYVDQVMGAFMFMRTTIFEKVGYFDERFFVYYEDLDFSKRVAISGGHSYYNSNIKAMHSGGGTTENVKAFRLSLSLRSRLLYAKKYFNFIGYAVVWSCTFCIEPITRILLLITKGKLNDIRNVYRGYALLVKKNSN